MLWYVTYTKYEGEIAKYADCKEIFGSKSNSNQLQMAGRAQAWGTERSNEGTEEWVQWLVLSVMVAPDNYSSSLNASVQ